MNITPLQNYVLFKDVPKTQTKSGILIADNANLEETVPGEIVKLGENIKLSVQVGDKVLFKRHMCEDLMIEDKQYLIGSEECIFAKLND